MRPIPVFLPAIFVLVAVSIDASAQEASGSDIDHLKAQVEKQQARIEALESALAAQQQLLLKIASANSQKGILIPATEPSGANLTRAIYEVETRENPTQQQAQQPLSPNAQKKEDELQRGPEIADVTLTTPALNLGPAKIRFHRLRCPIKYLPIGAGDESRET